MRHGEKTFIEHLHFVREFNVLRLYMADITQQTRAFEALRSNDIRLHQIVDLMPQLIYVINWDEQLLMSNKAFKEFFGYSGVTPICFCGSSIEEDRTVMMEGTIVTLMETVEDRHGQKHELGTTKVPYQYIGDEGRQTHAVLAVSQDLTEVAEYERNQRQNLKQLKATLAGTVNTVIAISNMRDPYTAGHETRVADLAVAIASEMGRSADEIEELRIIAVLHDLGKIYVPAEILSKPGRLTETEFELVKTHPRVGYDIMKEAALPMHIANTILQHHERVDGSGYPLGIKGNKINPDARILAVADVVEAMNSHRPYRASLGIDEALKEIRKNIGKLYDPDVVKACLKLFKDRKFVFH
jgi:HD-GYP domain-containing protein (c-di-GMP phosphodiesterase class II)